MRTLAVRGLVGRGFTTRDGTIVGADEAGSSSQAATSAKKAMKAIMRSMVSIETTLSSLTEADDAVTMARETRARSRRPEHALRPT